MFLAALNAAGGLDSILSQILDYVVPRYSPEPDMQAALVASWKAAVKERVVRAWADDAVRGVKQFMYSGGRDAPMLLNLRPVKSAFLEQFEKELPAEYDYMERQMESIPDRPSLAKWLELDPLLASSTAYRIAADAPLTAGITAMACAVLLGMAVGRRRGGLRITGACLVAAGLVAFAAVSYAASGPARDAVQQLPSTLNDVLPEMIPNLISEVPVVADPRAMAQAAVDFAAGRARLASVACLAAGALLALIPVRKGTVTPSG